MGGRRWWAALGVNSVHVVGGRSNQRCAGGWVDAAQLELDRHVAPLCPPTPALLLLRCCCCIPCCLCLQVYETHGRIAIEVSDWAEFRQCHSVLQQLYADGMRVGGWVGGYVFAGGWGSWQCCAVLCCALLHAGSHLS